MDNIVRNKNNFDKWINIYCNKKWSFEVIKNGNLLEVTPPPQAKYQDKIVFYGKEKTEKIKGKHLITLLKKGVLNYKGSIPTGLAEPESVIVNPYAFIELDYYQQIDLDSAYFTAAYRLGYITQLQYINGMDEDWKSGRLASVGCLKRAKVKDIYVDGVLVKKNVQLPFNDVFINARLHIINYIADIMKECCKLAGNDKWVSVHVDAIILHYAANRKAITDYLKSIGFNYKFETIEITNIGYNYIEYVNKNKNKPFKLLLN